MSLALSLFLAWLLGGCRSSVARKLPPVLCGSSTGPGLSRARSLRHSLLMTGCLVLGRQRPCFNPGLLTWT